MTLLQDKNRDYRRWDHSGIERFTLAKAGFQAVQSSNVSAVGKSEDDLVIRFHNGGVYKYYGMGDKVVNILQTNSKGKWVWRFLRRAGVSYERIGDFPLPDDLEMTDEELFDLGDKKYYEEMTEHTGGTREIVETEFGKMEYITIMGREMFRLL